MGKISKILISIVSAAAIISIQITLHASDNFVRVSLPRGVSIELPKNWIVLSKNQRITLDSAVESGLDLSGIEQEESELPFAANYYDDKQNTIGILNIRYYPQLDITQEDARSATLQDIEEIDSALKENIYKPAEVFGMKVSSWNGTQKKFINGIIVFLTEYQRNSQKGDGEFLVRLVRVFSGNRSFTLTVSYHEKASFLLKPITDKIINSLNLEGVKKISAIKTLPANEKPENSSIMSDLYGQKWGLVLFLSFLLTWAVGLLPPVLIRFVFLRRPIGNGWAICVVALLWIFNIGLFTALGSQSKTHGGLVLVVFVSYAILRKGTKKQVVPL